MVLEATVLVIDNSEYSRNGDFPRTRFEAQIDSVEFIFQAKRNSNPENTVGLISGAGANPRVLSTFTAEFGKILAGLHDTQIEGKLHMATALQIAQLTLKHRQNKVQHQRIVAFVCSPISDSRDELIRLAKTLKKNNVAVDIINFGEIEQNTELLDEFIAAVNNPQEETSHLLTVTPGPRLLYENIASSPIILEEGSSGMGAFGGSGGDSDANGTFMDFGVDPSMDPELAMALRLSMEEEQQRQERLRQQQQQQDQPEQPEQPEQHQDK
ncbi:Rpn10p [Saccharomyces cerevisiae YJM1573]|uniref:K7_Rpn10p n=1 Tax=Saccharomyces cerevisiae (strain Kyokai no. 7 / NBRC 101557) TaxID=721032 RepID=G2WFS4_YEASK|nr:Rpn10p [Saccharomyces cerevisiae YJM1388]AJU19284.1 Rpn10p [Saccharomyces cerevisiae YJM1402]AJU20056.1 Rpn10p [Saccharomyces cerevisiae YJM1418]AJU20807.1 Rpn10p [Saccharomyces cerevisiae YJM1434]AJU24676.1 Rpn10p [Saccharomyces cerevisiae YJM1573]AJU29323.1 Rpn10p [Saccharomyces cerevisiae YJM456]AJV30194.1 Rpn10p [Saccharomyces cerevisiae YJM1273]AJV30950.1 Rpn10p [Saccharomyces cerevisiae YJM1311]CAD6628146.1 EM14S01-3B_G0056120.mRNA.1.CDS.1 [Saccharomyces cerevisiae]GAA23917.1 K7_R